MAEFYLSHFGSRGSLSCVQDVDIDIGMMATDSPAIAVSSIAQHEQLPLLQDWLPPLSKQSGPNMMPPAGEKVPHEAHDFDDFLQRFSNGLLEESPSEVLPIPHVIS